MKKNIVFFEAVGGSDKGADGHRKDTMPMVNALKAKGWNAEVVFLATIFYAMKMSAIKFMNALGRVQMVMFHA